VFVAGDFNDWSATRTPLRFDERLGTHEIVVELPPGRYCYRLVIDGRWTADPNNQHKLVNEYGEFNSVVVVPVSQDDP
jgi:1,4-alpha-glucan branching enzyme